MASQRPHGTRPWLQLALCVGMDPEVFFPGPGPTPKAAKDACQSCPVLIPCTFESLRRPDDGFRAGLTRAERARIRTWDRAARKRQQRKQEADAQ